MAETIWIDGRPKCEGPNCPNVIYNHHSHFPHLCLDCVQPHLAEYRDVEQRLFHGELTHDEAEQLKQLVREDAAKK